MSGQSRICVCVLSPSPPPPTPLQKTRCGEPTKKQSLSTLRIPLGLRKDTRLQDHQIRVGSLGPALLGSPVGSAGAASLQCLGVVFRLCLSPWALGWSVLGGRLGFFGLSWGSGGSLEGSWGSLGIARGCPGPGAAVVCHGSPASGRREGLSWASGLGSIFDFWRSS